MRSPTEKFHAASTADRKDGSARALSSHRLQQLFLRNYAEALRYLLIDGYLWDMPYSQIRLSIRVAACKQDEPTRIILAPARVDNFDVPLHQISWKPQQFRHGCLDGIRSLFVDMAEIIQDKKLNIRLADTKDGKVFVFESSSPQDMIQLLWAHQKMVGYKTLDDRTTETLTTRKAGIPELAARFMRHAPRRTATPADYLASLGNEPIPPRSYLSPEHALVGTEQMFARKTIAISYHYLENLGRQAMGIKIPENQGLLRLQ